MSILRRTQTGYIRGLCEVGWSTHSRVKLAIERKPELRLVPTTALGRPIALGSFQDKSLHITWYDVWVARSGVATMVRQLTGVLIDY